MSDHLQHFGVKGMKWGVRRDNSSGSLGTPRKTEREAKKDAEEFTRAKLYYGEGAGTRRKLIKNTVEAKSKRDPAYKEAFDRHVANTDLAKRASQARAERKSTDRKNSAKKTVRGFRHVLNGNSQYASATAAILAGGYLYARKNGIDQQVYNAAKQKYSNLKNNKSNMDAAKAFLKDLGML